MAAKSNDGLQTYIAGKTKEKIEEEIGIDLGIITQAESFISILELKEIATNKMKRVDKDIHLLKSAIIKAQRKKNQLIEARNGIVETLKEVNRIDRNNKIREFIMFRKEVTADVSKLALVTGNIKQERTGQVAEVLG